MDNYEFKLDSIDCYDLKLKKEEATEKTNQPSVDKKTTVLKDLELKKTAVPLKIDLQNSSTTDNQIRVIIIY